MRPHAGGWPASRAVLAAVVSGALYAQAQPDRGGWPLAFVCLVPLLAALRGRGLRARFGLGWLCGTVAAVGLVLEPTGAAVTRYFEIPAWQGYAAAFLLGQLFGALSLAVFAALAGDPHRHGVATGTLRAGAALVAAEAARSSWFTGLPWGLLAYALAPVPELARSASLGGTALLSFLLAAVNAALFAAASPGLRRRSLVAIGLAGAALASPAALPAPDPGAVRRARPGADPGDGTLRVLLVQGSVPGAWRRDPSRVRDGLDRLVELSSEHDADLVVWPESALAAPLPANESLVLDATASPALRQRFLLLGAPRVDASDPTRVHNSAVLFGPDRRILGHHDKTRLVPFTEYVPRGLDWLGLAAYHTAPGSSLEVLRVGDVRIGALVCYELIFPRLARKLVRGGADLLLNLSNDEWFGTRRGREQHFAAAVLRAIETSRPVLRATNTGITAAIDSTGRVVARLAPERPAALLVEVRPASRTTLYVRAGEWARWAALAACALFLGADLRRGVTRSPAPT